jgi:alpha-glucosidase
VAATARAGFSSGEPWLPPGDDANRLNVEAARADPDSMLSLHRRLLALRRAEPALSLGSFDSLGARGGALAYLRAHAGRSFLVALNLSAAPARIDAGRAGRIRVATDVAREGQRAGPTVELAADEAVVVELD